LQGVGCHQFWCLLRMQQLGGGGIACHVGCHR
jgi:hypothetical protein